MSRYGKKCQNTYFIARFRPGTQQRNRFGVTVTKKVGCAAQRNRLKRLSREYFRTHRYEIKGIWDINIIVKQGAADSKTTSLNSALKRIFDEISNIYI